MFRPSTSSKSICVEANRVRLACGCHVFAPNLDCFVTFCSNHTQGRLIKSNVKNCCLTWEGSRLQRRLDLLEVVSWLPVKEVKGSVVATTHHNVVSADGQSVDHGWMVGDRAHLFSLWALPDSDLVSTSWGEGVFGMVVCKGTHSFLVVGQSFYASSFPNVPKLNHLVVGARNYLWFVILHNDAFNNVSVSRHAENLFFSAHIPESNSGVTTSCCQNV